MISGRAYPSAAGGRPVKLVRVVVVVEESGRLILEGLVVLKWARTRGMCEMTWNLKAQIDRGTKTESGLS